MAPENTPNIPYGQSLGYGMNPTVEQSVAQQQPQQFYQPNFQGYVVPAPVQNQPTYVTSDFSGLYRYPFGYIPQNFTFDQFVTPQQNDQIPQNSFKANSLVYETPVSESVGLSMNKMIVEDKSKEADINNEQVQQNYTPVSMAFNGLVVPADPRFGTEKFAVQAIPEHLDRSMLPSPISTLENSAINEINAHLSKNNKPVQSSVGGRKINNWFTRLLDQRGEDYISSGKLTMDEVSRNADRIIDDLVSGRIDYSKQGNYIIQPVILDTLINYCANKLAINRAIQFSLGYVYNDYTNIGSFTNDPERFNNLRSIDDALSRNITQSIAIVNQDISIYELLFNKLSYVNTTKNASSLFSLQNELNNLKKAMKKRY